MLSIGLAAHAQVSPHAKDVAPVHGFVDPCRVNFVEDSTLDCEFCSTAHQGSGACAEKLESHGYERKCRTAGHSEPGEVWCRPKANEEDKLRKELVLALCGAATFLGAFFFLKRRRRTAHRKKSAKSAAQR